MNNMKASELRIGNYLRDQNGDIGKIVGINSDKEYNHNGQLFVGTATLYYDDFKGSISRWIETLAPIPLTVKTLSRYGFKYKDGEYIRGLWKLAPDYPKREVIGYGLFIKRLDWTRTNNNSIKYMHQLQNLFFGITGHELEVTL